MTTSMIHKWDDESFFEKAEVSYTVEGSTCNLVLTRLAYKDHKVITGITLLAGTNKLNSGSTNGTIRIWDCHTGQSLKVINFGTEVNSLISEGPWIFVGLKNAIKALNTKTNLQYTLDGPKGRILHMIVGNNILFTGRGNLVCMYELPSFSERGRLFARKDITSFALGADRGLFFTGDGTGLLRIWKRNELSKVASN
ncbi:hypothetical protein DEO72_LG5g2263 [Vigna unguiculata]|uniref:Uncharacterized protein n=1 Tax=Vigna unguiculata TaxID=3917 RepID=A0A4D6M0B4_VIGUN|nr:hypothetical protein DEO72_LG5g2263 [Vigna unguiculata]